MCSYALRAWLSRSRHFTSAPIAHPESLTFLWVKWRTAKSSYLTCALLWCKPHLLFHSTWRDVVSCNEPVKEEGWMEDIWPTLWRSKPGVSERREAIKVTPRHEESAAVGWSTLDRDVWGQTSFSSCKAGFFSLNLFIDVLLLKSQF